MDFTGESWLTMKSVRGGAGFGFIQHIWRDIFSEEKPTKLIFRLNTMSKCCCLSFQIHLLSQNSIFFEYIMGQVQNTQRAGGFWIFRFSLLFPIGLTIVIYCLK